jgi:hypothetical protein
MDFSGEKEFKGAMSLMYCLIVAKEAGWKILGSSSRVMSRVFDGGEGCESGGKDVRSRDKGDRDLFLDSPEGEDDADMGGESEGRCCVWMGAGVCRRTRAMVKSGGGG